MVTCSKCNKALSKRELEQTRDNPKRALRIRGEWCCRSCYDSGRNANIKENTKTSTLFLPLYSSQDGECLFENCDQTEFDTIGKELREKCSSYKSIIIAKGSVACSEHQNKLSSLDFDASELIQIADCVKLTPKENTQLFQALADAVQSETQKSSTISFSKLNNNRLKDIIGLDRAQFDELQIQLDLCQLVKPIQDPDFTLGLYLLKMKTGLSDHVIGAFFGKSRRDINYHIHRSRELLNTRFVPRHLGLARLSVDYVWSHTTDAAKAIFPGEKKAILPADGTYVFIQKSSNFGFQRESFSLHKHRNLKKMFMVTTTDGLIVAVTGPHDANVSDAYLLEHFMSQPEFCQLFPPGSTIFIVDRGFRNIIDAVRERGYQIEMPAFLPTNQKQLETLVANKTRFVTKLRWPVEAVNGQIKQHYRYFDKTVFNRTLHNAPIDFTICCALLNYLKNGGLASDVGNPEIFLRMNRLMFKPNRLQLLVSTNNLTRKSSNFQLMTDDPTSNGFPRLTLDQLKIFCCGSYQIKMALCYYAEHVKTDGRYEFSIQKESQLFDYASVGIEHPPTSLKLFKAKINSRHSKSTRYFIFVLLNTEKQGIDAIEEHYCTCKVGARTVGCCAHIASLVWYLTFACYEPTIKLPAQSLSSYFVELRSFSEIDENPDQVAELEEQLENELDDFIDCEVEIFSDDDDQDDDSDELDNNQMAVDDDATEINSTYYPSEL